MRKASKVYIEGSLRTRQWTDQNGQERYITEIRGDQMQMLDSNRQQMSTEINIPLNKEVSNSPNHQVFSSVKSPTFAPPADLDDDYRSDTP